MWVFKCNAFPGKTLLLERGKRYIVGRIEDDGGGQLNFPDKTVSRQHLMVEVPNDNADIHSPPHVTITDLKTKNGTFLKRIKGKNGTRSKIKRIRGKIHLLATDKNLVRIGEYEHHLQYGSLGVVEATFINTCKDSYGSQCHLPVPLSLKSHSIMDALSIGSLSSRIIGLQNVTNAEPTQTLPGGIVAVQKAGRRISNPINRSVPNSYLLSSFIRVHHMGLKSELLWEQEYIVRLSSFINGKDFKHRHWQNAVQNILR